MAIAGSGGRPGRQDSAREYQLNVYELEEADAG
jgi:hypothetical protein